MASAHGFLTTGHSIPSDRQTNQSHTHTQTNHRDYHWLLGHWTGHNHGTWMWTRHATNGHGSRWWPDGDRCYCCQLNTCHCPVFYTDMESVNAHVSVHSIETATGQNHRGTLWLMCAFPADLMLTDDSRALTLVSVRNKALLVHHNDVQSVNVHVTGHAIRPPTEISSDRQGNGWHTHHRYHHWLSGHWMAHQSQCNRLALLWVLSYIYTDSTMTW